MSEYRFGVKGQERKALVGAISEILNTPVNYLGAPTFAYEVGNYTIDKEGTVTGEYDPILFAGLAERGYEPEIVTEPDSDQVEESAGDTSAAEDTLPANSPAENVLTIEVPIAGFTPKKLDILRRLIDSKAPLIKTALGVEELPIQVGKDRIGFPWFRGGLDADSINAYAQFCAALADTAKRKSRVTAQPQDVYENPAFTMRVWLIGLGLVGPEFTLIRKLMVSCQSGCSSWRYGKPVKAAEKAAPAPETAGDAFAEEAPAETAPEEITAPAAEESEVRHLSK